MSEPKPLWLRIAEREIGVAELSGASRNNPVILDYFRATTLRADVDEVPWCAAFVGWVLQRSGFTGTRSARARSYESYGRPCGPEVGAIVVMRRGGNPLQGHVGFLVRHAQNRPIIEVLGGNQGDAVKVSRYDANAVIAYRWPNIGRAMPV